MFQKLILWKQCFLETLNLKEFSFHATVHQ